MGNRSCLSPSPQSQNVADYNYLLGERGGMEGRLTPVCEERADNLFSGSRDDSQWPHVFPGPFGD